MNDTVTKISITGKLTYSDEITISQAAQIITFLNSDEPQGVDLGGSLLGASSTSDKSKKKQVENAREAIEVSGAKNFPEKIVALGAYVLQDGGETFKAEDVRAAFRRARETAPANFPRDLTVAITSGWIAEDGPGEYYLTNRVEGIFDGGFNFSKSSAGVKSSKPRAASPKKSRTAASKPEVFASIDEFPITMEGFPPYSKMKTNRDKLLWAVMFAKGKGINGLSNKAIEWLTDHLGEGIPNRQITAAFNSAKAGAYVNRSTQDQTIRITEAGQTKLSNLNAES